MAPAQLDRPGLPGGTAPSLCHPAAAPVTQVAGGDDALPIRILAVSGSLRSASSNTQLLLAATRQPPPGVAIELYDGIGGLPHFSPDVDGADSPALVVELRARVASADALLISSPEYAHGVPGSLKNALDWLVSGVEIVALPVALLNAAPHSTHAQAALAETLKTMSAQLVPEASVTIPLSGRRLDASGILSDPVLAGSLQSALEMLVRAARATRSSGRRLVGWRPDLAP
jgi:chromate reductase